MHQQFQERSLDTHALQAASRVVALPRHPQLIAEGCLRQHHHPQLLVLASTFAACDELQL